MARTIATVCVVVLLAITSSLSLAETIRFDNYRVYSLNISDEQQLQQLRQLQGSVGYDFWRSADVVGATADIMVAPHKLAEFTNIMDTMRVQSHLMVDNVQRLIDNERPSGRATKAFGWTDYYDLEEIYAWLDDQIASYPAILSGLSVGQSYENRTIRAVKLSHKAGNPTIFIESNIHAREWITSATATWLLNELLTSQDPAVQELAQNFDWVIVPVYNVDGFAYTHKTNRMWRKNRHPHGHICYGADINRNFDAHWMEIGASNNICVETFAGPEPASEYETQALTKFITEYAGDIKMYLAFHSYGQYFMFPYGYTTAHVPEYDGLMSISEKYKAAVAVKFGTEYFIGPSSTTIYPTSGSTVDWAYDTAGIKLAYTVEFRDMGRYGFLLPAAQIVPNGQEFLDGLLAAVKEARVQSFL